MGENIRKAVYALAAAIGALAVGYGILTGDQAELWLGVVNASIGVLAVMHVGERGVDYE